MIAVLRQVVDAGSGEGRRWAGMRIHRIHGAIMEKLGDQLQAQRRVGLSHHAARRGAQGGAGLRPCATGPTSAGARPTTSTACWRRLSHGRRRAGGGPGAGRRPRGGGRDHRSPSSSSPSTPGRGSSCPWSRRSSSGSCSTPSPTGSSACRSSAGTSARRGAGARRGGRLRRRLRRRRELGQDGDRPRPAGDEPSPRARPLPRPGRGPPRHRAPSPWSSGFAGGFGIEAADPAGDRGDGLDDQPLQHRGDLRRLPARRPALLRDASSALLVPDPERRAPRAGAARPHRRGDPRLSPGHGLRQRA